MIVSLEFVTIFPWKEHESSVYNTWFVWMLPITLKNLTLAFHLLSHSKHILAHWTVHPILFAFTELAWLGEHMEHFSLFGACVLVVCLID